MGRYDPLTTLAVCFSHNSNNDHTATVGEEEQNPNFAVFQFIVRYFDREDDDDQIVTTRVCTHRLPIGRTVHEFMDGVDEQAIPVLLAKLTVSRSNYRGGRGLGLGLDYSAGTMNKAHEEYLVDRAKRDLDLTIHKISKAYQSLCALESCHRDDDDDKDDDNDNESRCAPSVGLFICLFVCLGLLSNKLFPFFFCHSFLHFSHLVSYCHARRPLPYGPLLHEQKIVAT